MKIGIWVLGFALWTWAGIFDLQGESAKQALKSSPIPYQKLQWDSQGHLALLDYAMPADMGDESFWELMDWLSDGQSWMEVDPTGILPKDIKNQIQGAVQVFYHESPAGQALLAVARKKPHSILTVIGILADTTSEQPLQCKAGDMSVVLGDYRKEGNRWVHRADSSLFATILKTGKLRLDYHSPDQEPFPIPQNYTKMEEGERRQLQREYQDYFRHEFGIAVRAFIESTPGLFQWQTWHWLRWGGRYLPTVKQIDALLRTPSIQELELLRLKCSDGRNVHIRTNLNGSYQMEIQ